MKIKYILFLLSTVMLTGCFTDFEPDLDSTPVVCVNANAVVGEPLDIFVSRTWRWSEERSSVDWSNDRDLYLQDAEVTLYVNDRIEEENIPCDTWLVDEWGYPYQKRVWGYRTDYIPKSGDKIRIVVKHSKYGDAEGETTVPFPVKIEDVIITPHITSEEYTQRDYYIDENGNYIDKSIDVIAYKGNASLTLPFTDPADITNYYYFRGSISGDWHSGFQTDGYITYDSEPLFTEHVSSLESAVSETSGYTYFSDRMISGKTYPLHIRAENIYYVVPKDGGFEDNEAYVYFNLSTISESYYKHVISVWESNDGINGVLGDIGLADPVWECSNVSTGAGVISAIAPSKLQIPLSKIVEAK